MRIVLYASYVIIIIYSIFYCGSFCKKTINVSNFIEYIKVKKTLIVIYKLLLKLSSAVSRRLVIILERKEC